MQPEMFLLSILFTAMALASADLNNPDFELPPSKLPQNSTAPFILLSVNNTIPGWTFEGTVQYVTTGRTISLPGNGHAIQLGQDGMINQTVIANDDTMDYLLTFTLAGGGDNCSTNAILVVSAPDTGKGFVFKQGYGKETWQSYGQHLGSWGDKELINLVIHSQSTESDTNSTCWPIIDALFLKSVETPIQSNDNMLLNGGFEWGPDFPTNSTEGILLDPELTPVQSALGKWSVKGTLKYIDSKNFFVPEGNAAVEIVSGVSTGLETASTLKLGSTYNLEFTLGDANDSCMGDFIVGARAGSTVENFTLQSNGTGSAKKLSMRFEADSSLTIISFLSYTTSQTKDGLFCGPVVDDVILRASASASSGMDMKLKVEGNFLICIFLLLLALI